MAEPRAYILSRKTMERAARAVRQAEAVHGPRGASRTAPPALAVSPTVGWVRLSSTTITDGRYPGHWYSFDPSDNSLTQEDEIWVRDVPGGKLYTVDGAGNPVYYPARFEGYAPDDTAVWATVDRLGGASAVTGPATVTTETATTNAAVTVLTLKADSTGTPSAGFGVKEVVSVETGTPGTFVDAKVETTTLTTVTAGAEVAQTVVSLVSAGSPTNIYTLTPTLVTFHKSVTLDGGATLPSGDTLTLAAGSTTTANGPMTFPTVTNPGDTPTGYVTVTTITNTGAPTAVLPEGALVFNKADDDLYVSLGGGSYQNLSSAGSGTIAGTIAAGQVAFGDGADSIDGTNDFTYTGGTLEVTDGDVTASLVAGDYAGVFVADSGDFQAHIGGDGITTFAAGEFQGTDGVDTSTVRIAAVVATDLYSGSFSTGLFTVSFDGATDDISVDANGVAFGTPLTLADVLVPAHLANASAPNDSVYYSTDANKLVYKDGGGTVNNLY